MELIKNSHSLKSNSTQINWARFSSSFVIEITRGSEVFTSSAVAIGKNTILTAAHCVDCADEVVVLIGDEYEHPDTIRTVSRWSVHHEYNPSKSFHENDLAILYLDEELPAFVTIETLDNEVQLSGHSLMERIGFGGRADHNIRTWITPSFIGQSFNRKSLVLKDEFSVTGDSGGPIYTEENGQLKLVGLHSTLEGHFKTYAVNLSFYKDWIDFHTSLEEVV